MNNYINMQKSNSQRRIQQGGLTGFFLYIFGGIFWILKNYLVLEH